MAHPMTVAATIAELNQLLTGTSITMLTLITPAETITLHRQPGSASNPPPNPSLPGLTRQSMPSGTALAAPWTPGSSPGVTDTAVTAPCSGVFLHRHPLREAPLVQVGQTVQAGAVLGLLQVGKLLLHITAPRAGTVAAVAAEAVVGYGTALVHLAAGEGE